MTDTPLPAPSTPFHRLRFLLRITRDTELHAHHAGIIYAVMANANRSRDRKAAVPDGLLIDVPDQCRTRLVAGEHLAVGGTWIDPHGAGLQHRLNDLIRGLRRLGGREAWRHEGLGGNFELAEVQDLVAGRRVDSGPAPQPVTIEHITREIERLLAVDELTLRFTAPLRTERPAADRRLGHTYFDREYFSPHDFLTRLRDRLPAVGIRRRESSGDGGEPELDRDAVRVIENRLVWLDIAYGPRFEKNTLGGAVGLVRLGVSDPLIKAMLVWGQYVRVGKNLQFGFGAYRIEELGEDPLACRRSESLVEVAMRSPELDRVAEQSGAPSGSVRVAAARVLDGTYRPEPHRHVSIADSDGSPRWLSIPTATDRALQRLVLRVLAPALDKLFESSSLAWRRGLGRHRAPKRVEWAFRDGFRYAVRADFDRFFESIDHGELSDRLRAYVADEPLECLILAWVRAGVNGAPQGLPTGAPLSPLLANLFLDRFDEQIESRGGRLIRYGDDFLILCRTEPEVDAMYRWAADLAGRLKLALNADPSPVLDFSEPFRFLGFEFSKMESWNATGDAPCPIERIAWFDASARGAAERGQADLPGEQAGETPLPGVAVLGPGLAEFTVANRQLHFRYHGRASQSLDVEDRECLTILGPVSFPVDVIDHVLRRGPSIVLADASGRVRGVLGDAELEDPETLLAQARLIATDSWRLAVARALIAAKLHNYAALARATDRPGPGAELAGELVAAAGHAAAADSLDALRGVEGAGAARWYAEFSRRLGTGFTFERRVAPNAEDPVNVLLNIGYSTLFRWMVLAARAAGLSPVLGTLHTTQGRYPALAADLQEPFRHLVDRAVIRATHRLKPAQFVRDETGVFPLRLTGDAARQFQLVLHGGFATAVAAEGQQEPFAYRQHFVRQARALRRHLLDPAQPFRPFYQP